MKCKKCKRNIPENALFCCWCGNKLIETVDEIKVPAPKQLPSGTYFGRIMVDGKRVSISAETEKEYYTKARATKTGIMEIKNTPSKMTLGEAFDNYINSIRGVRADSTIRTYKTRKGQVGDYAQKQICSIDFQELVNYLFTKYEAKTATCIWGVVSSSLRHEKIPVPEVKLKRLDKKQRLWLDYKQIQIFLEQIKGKPIELTALLALHSLRQSEIMALKRNDISNGFIHVRGAMVCGEDYKYHYSKSNKTYESTRDIPILIPRLEELLDTSEDPHILHPSNIRLSIRRECVRAGLPPCTCHSLRHSFASLAYHLKWDTKTTQKYGGWSSDKVLNEIYSHLATDDELEDVQTMKNYYINQIGNDLAMEKEIPHE